MSGVDWRSLESYRAIQDLDAPSLAWEFLRRSPNYVRDHDNLAREDSLQPVRVEEFAQRWRLRFRGRSRAHGARAASLLDAVGAVERRLSCSRFVRACRKLVRYLLARLDRRRVPPGI
ncbi:hypothetical protein SAMN05519103_03284 [Rhizobiales bacterium GAS113]|nr:hypothetical protein SAMN05519103_03284 [Rhizobiales bacterium GAS113]